MTERASHRFEGRVKVGLGIVAVWTAAGLVSASQYYVSAWSRGEPTAWGPLLGRELPVWWIWILLTPAALLLARRFPLERGRLARHLPLHLAAAALVGVVYIGFWLAWIQTVSPYEDVTTAELFWILFRGRFNLAFLLYWGVIGAHHALWNYRRYREREVEAVRAQEELAQARLRALKMQIHPHFLFNTLHAASSLMDEDVGAARRVLARLGDLLRATLESEGVQEVPLEQELEFLARYLEIERARFGERLEVAFRVEPVTEEALVPTFLLQPLVENAIRHGATTRDAGGRVEIGARRRNGWLVLTVEDDGPGLPPASVESAAGSGGVGLSNTRARLRHLYGDDHTFELASRDGRGLRVTIEIPLRVAGAAR